MCGIIGYIGQRKAMPILLQGLLAQEYRGYDSAGIALLEGDTIRLVRSTGKIVELAKKIMLQEQGITAEQAQFAHVEEANKESENLTESGQLPFISAPARTTIEDCFGEATVGIGHTRWATHGRPSVTNAHPHPDGKGEVAMVHNGIIENYLELRDWLGRQGHVFASETDTEVLPHLLEHFYSQSGDLLQAMQETVGQLRGAYATVAVCKQEPRKLVAARQDSPLVIGIGKDEYFFASDIAALIRHTRNVLILENGDTAIMSDEGVVVYHHGEPVEREIHYIDWDYVAAAKSGYDHFMIKEIKEQPWSLNQTLQGRISATHLGVELPELDFSPEYLRSVNKIMIVACGTAYHAGLVGKTLMEKMLKLPVEVDIASEFRYRDPLVDEHTLMIVVSQSGETADTRAALREGKQRGAKTVAICNVVASSIAQEADHVLYTYAGPEIAVASTKAYITQLMVLYLLTFYLAGKLGSLPAGQIKPLVESLYRLPEQVEKTIEQVEAQIIELSHSMKWWKDAFFIGRGLDYAVALEGALKLKEISYLHAEAYAAGELKHGTIALIEPMVPVIALCTQEALLEKMVSNIMELDARGACMIGVAFEGAPQVGEVCQHVIYLPRVEEILAPIIAVLPLQLFAYHMAKERNCEIDQPRNLAKSVTVE